MNRVILVGRFVKDSEVRTHGETMVARNTIAVDRIGAKGDQKADFISIVGFNKRAEFMEKFGKKGRKFAIEGHIQSGSYDDKDGKKVYTTDVIIDNIEFADSKPTGDATPPASDDGWANIPDGLDELPFE